MPPDHGVNQPSRRRHRGVDWLFIGADGRLRSGCSLILFIVVFRILTFFFEVVAVALYPSLARNEFSTRSAIASEFVLFLALLGSVGLVGLFEHRRILEFNLLGPNRRANFLTGSLAGFIALSSLVAAMAFGGWLRFGHVSLTGAAIPEYAFMWACVFFLVGCFEEGMFRCYLQFTFTRSINFWWALAIVTFICVDLLLRSKGDAGLVTFVWMQPMGAIRGNGMWGVIAAGSLGLLPCLGLYLAKAENAGFWYASWATSTLFGYIHVSNNGENWIGIFAAAAIGFVFCVSIWATG